MHIVMHRLCIELFEFCRKKTMDLLNLVEIANSLHNHDLNVNLSTILREWLEIPHPRKKENELLFAYCWLILKEMW